MEENLFIIKAINVSKTYELVNGTLQALQGISFCIKAREFVSIIGPSGCGKSTLIKIIGNLLEPTSGHITVDGTDTKQARLSKKFSYVFQNPVLLPWRRVIDNVQLPLEILPNNKQSPKTTSPLELLKMVGLDDVAKMYPKELSGGMQHRVALARALAFSPQILFMDEPFASIDELSRNILNFELLRIWQEVGLTVLFVTHSLTEAVFLSNRVIVLSDRPARVKVILDVPFSFPREESLKETTEFQEKITWLRENLKSEN